MALIKCPECNGKVSDTIITCIHCGFDLQVKKVGLLVIMHTDQWDIWYPKVAVTINGYKVGVVKKGENFETEIYEDTEVICTLYSYKATFIAHKNMTTKVQLVFDRWNGGFTTKLVK